MTLIELLSALLLASIVMSIAWSAYLGVTRQYQSQSDIRQFEYRVISAASLLKIEIERAGYLGCPRLEDGFPMMTEEHIQFSTDNKLTGTTDQVTVRHAAFPPASVLEITEDQTRLKTDIGQRFKAGQVVIIVDCQHAEIKRIANIERADPYQYISFAKPLASSFDAGAEISPLKINRYYIANHALFVQEISGRNAMLIEGIEAMILSYQYTNKKLMGVTIKLQARQGKVLKNWYSYASMS